MILHGQMLDTLGISFFSFKYGGYLIKLVSNWASTPYFVNYRDTYFKLLTNALNIYPWIAIALLGTSNATYTHCLTFV